MPLNKETKKNEYRSVERTTTQETGSNTLTFYKWLVYISWHINPYGLFLAKSCYIYIYIYICVCVCVICKRIVSR